MKELIGQVALNTNALQTHSLVLRRCSACEKINRLQFKHAMTARCGICSGELKLSYYDVLGVMQTAAPDEIRKAFHQAVHKWHPDKCRHDESANRHFQRIIRAYHTLKDPRQREDYDKTEVARIHVQLRPQNTDSEPENVISRPDFDTAQAKAQQRPSTNTQSDNSSGADIDATRETVHLIATTSVMLLGVIVWALLQRSSANSSSFLLWIAVATGLYGVGKFLFQLSER